MASVRQAPKATTWMSGAEAELDENPVGGRLLLSVEDIDFLQNMAGLADTDVQGTRRGRPPSAQPSTGGGRYAGSVLEPVVAPSHRGDVAVVGNHRIGVEEIGEAAEGDGADLAFEPSAGSAVEEVDVGAVVAPRAPMPEREDPPSAGSGLDASEPDNNPDLWLTRP